MLLGIKGYPQGISFFALTSQALFPFCVIRKQEKGHPYWIPLHYKRCFPLFLVVNVSYPAVPHDNSIFAGIKVIIFPDRLLFKTIGSIKVSGLFITFPDL